MNENEKDFMEQLNNLNDSSVEEIAVNYPALDENAKKRILKQSLRKSGLPDDDIEVYEEPEDEETEIIEESVEDDEISVSGIEQYNNRISWHKYASSAVAMLIAVIGITSVVLLHRNMNENDDFDISNPPFTDETEPMTEIVSGSYIDKGYRAGGFDYANINGYEGSVQYGITTATEPPPETTESIENTNEISINNNVNEDISPADSHQDPVVTTPPATTPPVTTAQQPTTVADVTEPISSEAQKTYLDLLYYVEVSGSNEYMGFEFRPDGTLTKYVFDEYGVQIISTIVETTYEIVENKFTSEGRTGTIVNPNDSGNFTVKFDDGEVYNFNMQRPAFKYFFYLNGTNWFWWNEENYSETFEIEFIDDHSGNYIIYPENVVTMESTKIPFTYEKNGYEIIFHIEDPSVNVLKVELNFSESDIGPFDVIMLNNTMLAVGYADGSIKYFHNGN